MAGNNPESKSPIRAHPCLRVEAVRADNAGEVDPARLGDPGRLWGRAVLVHTGWARRRRTPAYREPGGPHLGAAATWVRAVVLLPVCAGRTSASWLPKARPSGWRGAS